MLLTESYLQPQTGPESVLDDGELVSLVLVSRLPVSPHRVAGEVSEGAAPDGTLVVGHLQDGPLERPELCPVSDVLRAPVSHQTGRVHRQLRALLPALGDGRALEDGGGDLGGRLAGDRGERLDTVQEDPVPSLQICEVERGLVQLLVRVTGGQVVPELRLVEQHVGTEAALVAEVGDLLKPERNIS